MALGIQEDVLRLEVPVYDVLLVKSLDGANDLGSVQFRTHLMELLLFPEVREQLTSVEEVDEEVQLSIGLEGKVKPDDVWVLDLFEDVSLS